MMAELRQRKKKRGKGGGREKKNDDDNDIKKKAEKKAAAGLQEDKDGEEPSTWYVFSRHPVILCLVFIGIPYLFYVYYRYVILQRPYWLLPFINLRPAVSMSSKRQLLIVGSMSSGTSQVAHELQTFFEPSFEIGHEDTDTLWKFVRDGTVSWFHGIRFFPPPNKYNSNFKNNDGNSQGNKTTITKLSIVSRLCAVAYSFRDNGLSDNYGFGPTLFGSPNYTCSPIHPQFKRCWYKECVRLLSNEYGCAYSKDKYNCTTPFQRTLLQTRKPIDIIKSLAAKYCSQQAKDNNNDDGIQQQHDAPNSLLRFFHVLFDPIFATNGIFMLRNSKESIIENNNDNQYPKDTSNLCTSQMANYVLYYYTILLDAYDSGMIDGMFRIESSTICNVAELAGLHEKETTIYFPNHEQYANKCQEQEQQGQRRYRRKRFGKEINTINHGKVETLDLEDDQLLIEKIKNLSIRMKYNDDKYHNIPEEEKLNELLGKVQELQG